MAITKKMTEIFRRYLPDEESRRILDAGHDLVLRMHPSKEAPERVEIEITFDFHVEDTFLHRVEEELRQCYQLRSVWIFPHFPSDLFSVARMAEITDEAVRIGAITRGFFEGVTYQDDGETVTAELLYDENGVMAAYKEMRKAEEGAELVFLVQNHSDNDIAFIVSDIWQSSIKDVRKHYFTVESGKTKEVTISVNKVKETEFTFAVKNEFTQLYLQGNRGYRRQRKSRNKENRGKGL